MANGFYPIDEENMLYGVCFEPGTPCNEVRPLQDAWFAERGVDVTTRVDSGSQFSVEYMGTVTYVFVVRKWELQIGHLEQDARPFAAVPQSLKVYAGLPLEWEGCTYYVRNLCGRGYVLTVGAEHHPVFVLEDRRVYKGSAAGAWTMVFRVSGDQRAVDSIAAMNAARLVVDDAGLVVQAVGTVHLAVKKYDAAVQALQENTSTRRNPKWKNTQARALFVLLAEQETRMFTDPETLNAICNLGCAVKQMVAVEETAEVLGTLQCKNFRQVLESKRELVEAIRAKWPTLAPSVLHQVFAGGAGLLLAVEDFAAAPSVATLRRERVARIVHDGLALKPFDNVNGALVVATVQAWVTCGMEVSAEFLCATVTACLGRHRLSPAGGKLMEQALQELMM